MQTITCYYYPNAVDVQLNIDPTLKLRNLVVYMRTVKLYKGIDNTIRFTFKNQDQQRVNITGWVAEFHIISDDEGSIVVSKPMTAIDAEAGVVTVVVNELDLLDLNNRFYHYSISVTDPLTGQQEVVYADDNYGVRGIIDLQSGHYPTFKPSINVTLPQMSNIAVTSSAVQADTPTLQQSSHHTAQYYFDTLTGTVEVQATLDSLPPNGNTGANVSPSWATIASTEYVARTANDFINFDGVYTAVRFVITSTSGSVKKILYRS